MTLTDSIALINASKITAGMFPGNLEYFRALKLEGFDVSWYQCTDSKEVNEYFQSGKVIPGTKLPFNSVKMGVNRMFTFPRKLKNIPESLIILLDPTLINVGRDKSNVAVKIHDLRPFTEYGDRFSTYLMFRHIISRLGKQKMLIVTTEYMREEMKNLGVDENRIRVLHESTDLPYRENHIDKSIVKLKEKEKLTLFYIASNRSYKNIDFFVSLAKHFVIKKKDLDLKFLLISQLERQDIIRLGVNEIENLEVRSNVKNIETVYEEGDILLHPSLFEGFGRPLVEAMRFGIPIIGNNIQPLNEIVGDAGKLVPVNDIDQWIAAIVELTDPERYRALANSSYRRAVEVYSDDNFRKDLRGIVDKLSQ